MMRVLARGRQMMMISACMMLEMLQTVYIYLSESQYWLEPLDFYFDSDFSARGEIGNTHMNSSRDTANERMGTLCAWGRAMSFFVHGNVNPRTRSACAIHKRE